MDILNLLIRRLVQIVNNETFTKSVREIINQHNAAIRPTPVAGDGARPCAIEELPLSDATPLKQGR